MPNREPYYRVAWRDEFGECGEGRLLGLARAEEFARQFTGHSWAGIIDPVRYTFLNEYGVRFADLQKLARKPPVRSLLSGGRAIAAGAAQAC